MKKTKPFREFFLCSLKKLLKIMRVAIILFIAGILQAQALDAWSQNPRLTLNFTGAEIEKVFDRIEEESDFFFLYNESLLNTDRKIDITADNQSIDVVLENLFAGTDIMYTVIDKKIILAPENKSEIDKTVNTVQQLIVTGKVTDSQNGLGMPGVNIIVKGTTMGTMTDSDGNFSITVPSATSVLTFSFIGYLNQEINLNGRNSINVALVSDVEILSEVVVVGYGVQKKVNQTGSIASVESEKLASYTTVDLSNTLAGKMPGLRVMQIGGEPGAYDNKVDIRGWGEMLVIVDGIPREDFQRIDPNTIASVSILKDASAAVYGVKAANGVMLITTKKGEAGKMAVTVNASYGIQTMTDYPKSISNSIDNLTLLNEAALVAGNPLPYPDWEKYTGEDPDYPSIDYWGLVFRDFSPTSKNSLSFTGGSERISYFMSVSNFSQEDVWKQLNPDNKSGYDRYNFSANITAEILPDLKANLIFAGMTDYRVQPEFTYGSAVFRQNYMEPSYKPVYANNNPDYYYDGLADRNPLAIIDMDLTGYRKFWNKKYETTLNLTYDLPFIKGLQARGVFAYDVNHSNNKRWRKAYSEYKYRDGEYIPTGIASPTFLSQGFNESVILQPQISLNYRNTFFDNHNITALLLYEQRRVTGTDFRAERNYELTVLDQLNAGLTDNRGAFGADYVPMASKGIVGRVNYEFSTKYLAEFSFRYDGSSLFPENSRWGFFPAFSIGWRINEERFIKDNLPFINHLKIRLSHGIMGDDSGVMGFEYLAGYIYPSQSYIFNGSSLTAGASSKGLFNPNITWYTATTSNIGLEGNLWNSKLDFSIDVFRRLREGLLATRVAALPKEFGTALPQENLESDYSTGFEIDLGHKNSINEFYYEVRGNFTWARSRWKDREVAPYGSSYSNWRNNQEERWKNMRWGYGFVGQFQTEEELLTAPIQNQNGHYDLFPGDVRYEDWNEDGMISDLDMYPIGRDNDAEIFYGLDLSGSWKGLTLNVFFQGATNFSLLPTAQMRGPLMWGRNSIDIFMDRWHHEDPLDFSTPWVPGRFPISRTNFGHPPNQLVSEYTVQDVIYLRLKNIELSYTLPASISNKIRAQELRIYTNASNVFTLKNKEVFFDPEKRLDGSEAASGYKYPTMANYNLGISVTF